MSGRGRGHKASGLTEKKNKKNSKSSQFTIFEARNYRSIGMSILNPYLQSQISRNVLEMTKLFA